MAIGLGVFEFAPLVFWSLTPKELDAALRGRFGVKGGMDALGANDLARLMTQYPDERTETDVEYV